MSDLTAFIEGMPKCELHVHIEGTLEPEMAFQAETALGVRSQLIMCFLRDWSAEFAMATLVQSLPYKEWIIGVGLDSDEENNPPVKFAHVYTRAQAEGYLLTMHCDVDQQHEVNHIWQAIRDIGVHRIDHGVNALEDQQLCEEIKRRSLALTVCPISNAYVSDSSKAEAIKTMLAQGMRVTVNSDDPAYFDGYMTENLLRVQKDVDLSRCELAQLAENAFESAWLPRLTRDLYVAELRAYMG